MGLFTGFFILPFGSILFFFKLNSLPLLKIVYCGHKTYHSYYGWKQQLLPPVIAILEQKQYYNNCQDYALN